MINKGRAVVVTMLVAVGLFAGVSGYAADVKKKIEVVMNAIHVKVNGTKLIGDNLVYNGNVYVQAEKLSKSLGKTYAWDKKKNVVTIADPKQAVLTSFNTQYLRFYESEDEMVEEADRVYADRFPKSEARFINWELGLGYAALSERKKFTVYEAYYRPDGTLFGEGYDDTTFYADKGWTSSVHTWGNGFDEAGQWVAGEYRVEVWINGSKAAEGAFEIYDDSEAGSDASAAVEPEVDPAGH